MSTMNIDAELSAKAHELSDEDVAKIAHLAHLSLTPEEAEQQRQTLSSIVSFVEDLNELDTKQVRPLAHPLDTTQRLRVDQVSEKNLREHFQKNAPSTEAGLFLVPQVIE